MPLETSRAVPMRPQPTSRSREALWATTAGTLLTLLFCMVYLKHTWVMNEADPRLLSEFQGHRPYQLRVLVPLLLHFSTHFLHQDVAHSLQVICIGFSLGLYGVFRAYLSQFCSRQASQWLVLSIFVPLFTFYSHLWFYLYDVPATFFATLGLLLIFQQRWSWYLVTFFFATLNRESSAFITLAFVLTMVKILPRRQFETLLLAQAGIWLLIRAVLTRVFAGNSGASIEWQTTINGDIIRELVLKGNAPPGFISTVILLGTLWVMSGLTKAFQPPFLRQARWIAVPFLALMGVVGVINETRLYGELIPVLLTPALIGVFGWNEARSHSLRAPQTAL